MPKHLIAYSLSKRQKEQSKLTAAIGKEAKVTHITQDRVWWPFLWSRRFLDFDYGQTWFQRSLVCVSIHQGHKVVLSDIDPSMRWYLRRMCPTLTNSAGPAALPFLTLLPLCWCCWHYCAQFDVPSLRTSFQPHLDPRSCPLLSFCFLLTTGGSAGKESVCNVGDLGLIPRLGSSPGEGKGYPLQNSTLEDSMDYTVHGVAKSQTRLSDFHFTSQLSPHCVWTCPWRMNPRRGPRHFRRVGPDWQGWLFEEPKWALHRWPASKGWWGSKRKGISPSLTKMLRESERERALAELWAPPAPPRSRHLPWK